MYTLPNRSLSIRELLQAAEKHQRLIYRLPENYLPDFFLPEQVTNTEKTIYTKWLQQKNYLPVRAASVLRYLLPPAELWLIPHHHQFTDDYAHTPSADIKPWFQPPVLSAKPCSAIVLGAGIAGAATARALAEYGVKVTVLESAQIAHAASGNRQGLLYAKISPHFTEQTELLLCGYGYTRQLLDNLLPEQENWSPCGVFHLNHNPSERERNRKLSEQAFHHHLYYGLTPTAAEHQTGLPEMPDGLLWQNGAWLHPPALVRALLNHPRITVYEHSAPTASRFQDNVWQIDTPQGSLKADHLIYCTGADSFRQPHLYGLSMRLIRGQTSLVPATPFSQQLHTALSGNSYISPAWQGLHCYGATFGLNDADSRWRDADELTNRQQLHALHPKLATSLLSASNPSQVPRGHSAVRCDSPDHLPIVGPVGDAERMQTVYAKLAADKNLRIQAACPYLPNVWVNTAHGSRGLATAPICAQSLAATILGLPNPLSWRIRQALHPNRLIIRNIVRQNSRA